MGTWPGFCQREQDVGLLPEQVGRPLQASAKQMVVVQVPAHWSRVFPVSVPGTDVTSWRKDGPFPPRIQ